MGLHDTLLYAAITLGHLKLIGLNATDSFTGG